MFKPLTIKTFICAEDGSVVTDWAVLTAGVMGVGIVVMISIASGSVTFADGTASAIESRPLGN